jgi:hypothetical protein
MRPVGLRLNGLRGDSRPHRLSSRDCLYFHDPQRKCRQGLASLLVVVNLVSDGERGPAPSQHPCRVEFVKVAGGLWTES